MNALFLLAFTASRVDSVAPATPSVSVPVKNAANSSG